MKHVKLYETFVNEQVCHQSVLVLSAAEKQAVKKLIPDATFEIDSDGGKHQLVFSNSATIAEIDKAIAQATGSNG